MSLHPLETQPSVDSPYLQKPISLIDSTFNLFGYLPADDDPRWSFLARYEDVKSTVGFSAMNFANAWGATYLSGKTSYRSGFVTTYNQENYLQLDRAIDNLAEKGSVLQGYENSSDNFTSTDMTFAVTDRLTTNPTETKKDVTPCPEALYQIRLSLDDRYLARVGFNIHNEADSKILSIVNIQGTPGSLKRNAQFEAEHGTTPFNMLVQRAVSVASHQESPHEVRGLINPVKGNSQLYWCALTKENVAMYHAQRKVIL